MNWKYTDATNRVVSRTNEDGSVESCLASALDDVTPDPADAPAIIVPSSVSPAQARLALLAAGLLPQVEAIVAAADIPTQIAWNNASVIERNSPTVAALAGALGLTDAQLDALFTTAAGIRV